MNDAVSRTQLPHLSAGLIAPGIAAVDLCAAERTRVHLENATIMSTKPGWRAYAGNFSAMAATEMVFGSELDFDLKREIAPRMLECPSTLEERPLLNFALRHLASGGWLDRVLFCTLWPAGKAESLLF